MTTASATAIAVLTDLLRQAVADGVEHESLALAVKFNLEHQSLTEPKVLSFIDTLRAKIIDHHQQQEVAA